MCCNLITILIILYMIFLLRFLTSVRNPQNLEAYCLCATGLWRSPKLQFALRISIFWLIQPLDITDSKINCVYCKKYILWLHLKSRVVLVYNRSLHHYIFTSETTWTNWLLEGIKILYIAMQGSFHLILIQRGLLILITLQDIKSLEKIIKNINFLAFLLNPVLTQLGSEVFHLDKTFLELHLWWQLILEIFSICTF